MATPQSTSPKSQTAPAHTGLFSKLEGTLKLRYLGIGFIWAWVYCSYETPAVYPLRAGMGINADESWLVSATVVTIALFVGGALLGRSKAAAPRWLGITAAASATVGTLLSTSTLLPAEATTLISGVLTGFGTALLSVIWGQMLAKLDAETSELAIPAASVIMVAGALIFPYLPSTIGVITAASLPFISGAMLYLTQREGVDCTPNTQDTKPQINASIIKIALLLFITYVTSGCMEAIFPEADITFLALGIDWPIIIGSSFGIIIMVAFLLFAQRPTFDTYFKGIAPLVVAALALTVWDSLAASFLTSTFFAIMNTILTVASVLCVVSAAQKGLANAALGIGVTQGSLQLGVLVGNVAGEQLISPINQDPTLLYGVLAALSIFFALVWFIYPTENPRPFALRTTAPARATSNTTPSTRSVGSAEFADTAAPSERSLDEACEQLATTYSLSGREREILGYLARGRSQPYIREELFLSKNTVATHVKHIYQKLDVHSRQELLDLIEATAAQAS